MTAQAVASVEELQGDAREEAVPILTRSFEGVYRWHAKRTLHEADRVRGMRVGGVLAGITMLKTLAPGVGYVYYVAVEPNFRRQGIGGQLLDDALRVLASSGLGIAYAAVEVHNEASNALFRSRGFRLIERDEPNYDAGGLGAHGLRTKMWIVGGEALLGRRIR